MLVPGLRLIHSVAAYVRLVLMSFVSAAVAAAVVARRGKAIFDEAKPI